MDFYDEDGNLTGTAFEAMAEEMDSDDYAGFIETPGGGRRGGDRGRNRRLQQNSLIIEQKNPRRTVKFSGSDGARRRHEPV